MSFKGAASPKPSSWPIAVGAAGIAAAQFARCGFDVMNQSGHDKPWYDLVITRGGNLLKIGVKATESGRWHLAESYLQRAAQLSGKKSDIQRAITLWLDIHGERTVYCLVQFEGIRLEQLPRIYLARPAEIAARMRDAAGRLGEAVLCERYEWMDSETGCTETVALPSEWLFSRERIEELLFPQVAQPVPMPAHVNRGGGLGSMNIGAAVLTA
jgi:hypothetical protein